MSVTQASNVVKCRNGWGTSYFNQLFGWLDGFNSTHCSAFYRALSAQHAFEQLTLLSYNHKSSSSATTVTTPRLRSRQSSTAQLSIAQPYCAYLPDSLTSSHFAFNLLLLSGQFQSNVTCRLKRPLCSVLQETSSFGRIAMAGGPKSWLLYRNTHTGLAYWFHHCTTKISINIHVKCFL